MMKYSIDIAKCYNWLDFMVRFLIQIVYCGTKAVRISDFKEHMKQSLFLWGSVFAPENLSLLGEATPCCLVTEKLGMVEQSSSIHTSTAHTHSGEREKVRERELSKVITEVWREDETEHASLFTSLTHFIMLWNTDTWKIMETQEASLFKLFQISSPGWFLWGKN